MATFEELLTEGYNGKISIKMHPENKEITFRTFDQFNAYLTNEISFWSRFNSTQISQTTTSYINAQTSLNQSNQLINSNIAFAKSSLSTAVNHLLPAHVLHSKTKAAKTIESLFTTVSPSSATTFYFGLFNPNVSIVDAFTLIGAIEAIKYNNKFNIDTFIQKVNSDTVNDLSNFYIDERNKLNDFYINTVQQIQTETAQHKEEVSNWRTNLTQKTETTLSQHNEGLTNLKNQYEEYLRLEAPAKYWADLKDHYVLRGKQWIGAAIAGSIVVGIITAAVLYEVPESLSHSGGFFSIENIKGTLLLALLLSLGIYLVRLFVKLSISAFHLSRDAQERLQLTHIYISLIKDGSVTAEQRNIVLQSLFSRADTGLLKGDHSPTIPDGITGTIFKNMNK